MESYILTQLMEAFESDATKPVITDAAKVLVTNFL